MMCRTCNTHHAEAGHHDCKRCSGLLAPVFGHVLDAAREIVRSRLSGPKPTMAERSAAALTVKWDASEVAHAIKRSIGDATEAVVTLPGVADLMPAEVDDVAVRLGCSVSMGTEPNTLLVVGYGDP
jgi:hypothetical protein